MPKSTDLLAFSHEESEKYPINLTKSELRDKESDWEDIRNQREYRDKQKQKWRWAGSVYNILQNASGDDSISQITLGWIRSYIDTGIAQMTAGTPEFDYLALGPSDESRTMLWKNLVETAMSRSNYTSHQNIAITDAHVFGPGVFEVYQQRPYRTIRVPHGDGFKDKVIIDKRIPRVGVRAISPFRVTRNPNVSDPNEVGSCTKEEILSWNQFVQKYGRVYDTEGKLKYKNIHMIPSASHVKVTIYQDEIRDILRIYALSYGNKTDGERQTAPEELGIPIFDRPLKIHDIYDSKGELIRSMGLNLPGMCNLVFLPYADKLSDDFEEHSLYGMGLPEHMEGLDTFMQTAFNMTVDNWRMGNTVVLDYQSRDGTTPSFDANAYYGGEYVNATVNAQTLGQDRTINFDNMYGVLQKMTIPGTGINIDQITGDPSNTAFEFEQRIVANNKRSETRLQVWEGGPLKRLGTLLLSGCISELTVHDLEDIKEGDVKKVQADLMKGIATPDDYEFKNGKPVGRKDWYYIDMKGWRENFTKKRRNRKLDSEATDNTLVRDKKNPDAVHKIPVTEKYVFPDWYAESGILFDTKVDSKRMITNKRISDYQGIQTVIQNLINLMQADPSLAQKKDISKLFDAVVRLAGVEIEDLDKEATDSEEEKMMAEIEKAKQLVSQTPNAPLPGQPNAGQPQANGLAAAGAQNPATGGAFGTV